MVFKGRISEQARAYVKFHKQKIRKYGKDNAEITERLASECKITTHTVYRLLKEPVTQMPKPKAGGWKKKVSARREKRMIRNIARIRATNKNWIVRDLLDMTDIHNISERTGQRILNRNGFNYSVARKRES